MVPGVLALVTAARREVIHFMGLGKVLNVFSREGEHTFLLNKKTAIFLLCNPSESGQHSNVTLKYHCFETDFVYQQFVLM